jgi:hypothetical protein
VNAATDRGHLECKPAGREGIDASFTDYTI